VRPLLLSVLLSGCCEEKPTCAEQVEGLWHRVDVESRGVVFAHAFSAAESGGVTMRASGWLPRREFADVFLNCSGRVEDGWQVERDAEVTLQVDSGPAYQTLGATFAFDWDGEAATAVEALVEISGPFYDTAAAVGLIVDPDEAVRVAVAIDTDGDATLSVGSWTGPATLTPWIDDEP
jgi:hypothetical protein